MQGAIPNKSVLKKVNKSDGDVLFSRPEHKRRKRSAYRPEESCWFRHSESSRIAEGFKDMNSDY